MRTRFRIFLLPTMMMIPYLLVLAAAYGLLYRLQLRFGNIPFPPEILKSTLALTCGGAVIYALLRVILYHPAIQPSYGKWLLTTPWAYPQPLPLGPVRVVWQDVLFVGILTAASSIHFDDAHRVLPCVFFAMTYGIASGMAAIRLREYCTLIAVAVLGAAVVFFWPDRKLPLQSEALLVVAAAVLVVAHIELVRVLRKLPHQELLTLKGLAGTELGFMKVLSSKPQKTVPIGISLLIAFTIGAWTVAGVSRHEYGGTRFEYEECHTALSVIAGIFAFFRTLAYCAEFWPPISIRGRLANMRPMIWGYDKVLVAPLATALIPWIVLPALYALQIPLDISCGVVMFLVALATWAMGPSMRSWQLTGMHRMYVPQTRARNARTRMAAKSASRL